MTVEFGRLDQAHEVGGAFACLLAAHEEREDGFAHRLHCIGQSVEYIAGAPSIDRLRNLNDHAKQQQAGARLRKVAKAVS